MFGWKTLLQMILPMLEAVGQGYIDRDDNDEGKDDIEGQSILYAIKIFRAVLAGKEMPKAPKELH